MYGNVFSEIRPIAELENNTKTKLRNYVEAVEYRIRDKLHREAKK
jgi:hypothetical protein